MLKKYLLIICLNLLSIQSFVYSFAVSDIEIQPKLRNSAPENRTFIIDMHGSDTNFLKPGVEFSVFRNDKMGILNHVGIVKAISTGKKFCKAKEEILSSTLWKRNLEIKNIAKGDIAIPSLRLYSDILFQNNQTPVLTLNGLELITNRLMPMINTESFTRIKVIAYNDNGYGTDAEIELGDFQTNAIKKYLENQFNIPSGFIATESIGNLQNLYANVQKNKNNRIEVLFLSDEEIITNNQDKVIQPIIKNLIPEGFLNQNMQPNQTNTFTIQNTQSENMQPTRRNPPTQISRPKQSSKRNNELEETKDVGDIILRED